MKETLNSTTSQTRKIQPPVSGYQDSTTFSDSQSEAMEYPTMIMNMAKTGTTQALSFIKTYRKEVMVAVGALSAAGIGLFLASRKGTQAAKKGKKKTK